MPDIIVKATPEPGFGHYELYGIARFFKDEKIGTDRSDSPTAFLPVIPGLLERSGTCWRAMALDATGPAGMPDATYKADGPPLPHRHKGGRGC